MKKDKIEKKIRNIVAYVLAFLGGYILSLIAARVYFIVPKIKPAYEPLLWIGSLCLVILIAGIAGMMWQKNAKDEEDNEEENDNIKENKLDKNNIIKEISIIVFLIATVIFHHLAIEYRPSKIWNITPQYIFWLLVFWVSLLWTIIYIIIIEIKRNLKSKE